jgi:hypothetical protein
VGEVAPLEPSYVAGREGDVRRQELATLNQLLKKMTLYIEKHRSEDA